METNRPAADDRKSDRENDRPPEPANTQWLWATLPAIPLVLLVLKLWVLSRQDLQTMLVLVQYVNPLGLVTALIVALVWILPAAVVTVRTLSVLLLVSNPRSGSRLARESDRMPGWVVGLAVLLAALTWQLRFLPALLMAVLMIFGLDARRRFRRHSVSWQLLCYGIPIGAAVICYVVLLPGIALAFSVGEAVNGLLLLVPPGVAVLLTGPVPLSATKAVVRGTAIGAALFAPMIAGVMFLKAPILPTVAMELQDREICRQFDREPPPDESTCVLLGEIITVDDRMVTLLRPDGAVLFVPHEHQHSQVLCSTDEETPTSRADVRGWHVEDRLLDLLLRSEPQTEPDPRCQGRPLPAPEPSGSPTGPAPTGD